MCHCGVPHDGALQHLPVCHDCQTALQLGAQSALCDALLLRRCFAVMQRCRMGLGSLTYGAARALHSAAQLPEAPERQHVQPQSARFHCAHQLLHGLAQLHAQRAAQLGLRRPQLLAPYADHVSSRAQRRVGGDLHGRRQVQMAALAWQGAVWCHVVAALAQGPWAHWSAAGFLTQPACADQACADHAARVQAATPVHTCTWNAITMSERLMIAPGCCMESLREKTTKSRPGWVRTAGGELASVSLELSFSPSMSARPKPAIQLLPLAHAHPAARRCGSVQIVGPVVRSIWGKRRQHARS